MASDQGQASGAANLIVTALAGGQVGVLGGDLVRVMIDVELVGDRVMTLVAQFLQLLPPTILSDHGQTLVTVLVARERVALTCRVSLLISLVCALVAALAYGAATAVEHSATHDEATAEGGLFTLIRNPRWLLGMGGDTVGLLFQVVALSTGPVVLIQPILVLALPVSLPIAWALGGPKPGPTQYRACAWILGGLAVFFILVGDPGRADLLVTHEAIITTAGLAGVGVVVLALARRGGSAVRAAVYGGVAGAWFGLVAVLMDAASTAWSKHGLSAFAHEEGLVPLVILVLLGTASIALTQVAFRAGPLAASFPANLAADPVIAVILGATLLNENVSTSALDVVAYVLCLAAVVFGAFRLASGPGLLPVSDGRSQRRTGSGS